MAILGLFSSKFYNSQDYKGYEAYCFVAAKYREMIDNGHEVYSGVIGSFQRYVDSLVLLNLLPVHETSQD